MKSKHNMTDLGVKCTNPNDSAQQVKEKNGDNENVKNQKFKKNIRVLLEHLKQVI